MIRVHYLDLSSIPSLEVYLRQIAPYPLLNRHTEADLFRDLAEARHTAEHGATPCVRSRATLRLAELTDRAVTSNLRLVLNIVSDQYNGYYGILSALDLIQAGNMGLLEAVKRFDWTRGLRFSTYATYWIRKEISRSIKTFSKYVRLPEYISADLIKTRALLEKLRREERAEPTEAELASLDFKRKDKQRYFRRLRELAAFEQPLSLETPQSHDGANFTLADMVVASDAAEIRDAAEHGSLKGALANVLDSLAPKENAVVRLRFGLDDGVERSLDDIGRRVGCSREYARQLLKRAVTKLKQGRRADALKPYWQETALV